MASKQVYDFSLRYHTMHSTSLSLTQIDNIITQEINVAIVYKKHFTLFCFIYIRMHICICVNMHIHICMIHIYADK